MKKYLLILLAMILPVLAWAQEKPHLQFKGIPIEGSMTSFCQKLQAKGFTFVQGVEKNVKVYSGDFTGIKTNVYVISTDDGKNVFKVGLFPMVSNDWKSLENSYNNFKSLYTEKYGLPILNEENNPELGKGNSSEMFELSQGKVTWYSIFEAEGGVIKISIEKVEFGKGQVMIVYEDTQNTEAKRQKDLGDI